jgi:predicted esterase
MSRLPFPPGCIPDLILKPRGVHRATLIFMHGLGDTSEGWGQQLRVWQSLDGFQDIKMILPSAPIAPVTLNNGMRMPSWYDIVGLDDRSEERCTGIEESRARINALVDAELAAGIPANKIIIGGFSQGGAMSLYTG